MNIAIYTNDFNWTGGIDLLHGIVKGLLAQKTKPVKIYILIHDSSVKEPFSFKLIPNLKLLLRSIRKAKYQLFTFFKQQKTEVVSATEGFNISSYVIEIFSEENVSLVFYNDKLPASREKILTSLSADVVLPFLFSGVDKNLKVPWIGYMFDFVYKYHSHLYTPAFCLQTDIYYATILLNAKAVIVNSKEVFNDIKKFFPYADGKVFAMPFAPYTNISTYQKALNNNEVTAKYEITRRYFIICNQFWLHKSHETAFDALFQLHNSIGHKDVCLVCTGRMTDLSGTNNRKDELEKYARDLGLSNDIFFLGHISKVDQLALMLRSEGLLQPTTFEGGPGGGAVYMAVANGIPAIVSDIPVNREIENEPLVTFFKVKDSNDLAQKINEQLNKGFSLLSADQIEDRNKERLASLGNTLIESIIFVTKS